MHDSKRIIGLMAFVYLLGILTAGLALKGLGLLRGQQVPALALAGAGIALLLSAVGLGWALWVLTAGRTAGPARRSPGRGGIGSGEPPRSSRPARRRSLAVDLPTVTDYYENAPDGVLPAPAPVYRDLDPASDPRVTGAVGASA
jgi:hypothetical protein